MTDITASAPVVGRSLWADALARLKANRAAMFSLFYLTLMALFCVFGPNFTPHAYTTIYPDYVRTPPSLSAYPKPEMIETSLQDVVRRIRADLEEWHEQDERIFVTISSAKAIDDRVTRYLDRSDTFDNARIESKSPDGLKLTMSATVKKQYFFFGTDNTGRDLLTRTLMAGRVSLAIGLLAGCVAVVIGVLYGATAGFLGGKTDEVMMRIVDILYSLPFIFFVIMLVVFFGRNFVLMFLAVGAVLWLDMARIVRGQALALKRREFVDAARLAGVPPLAIIRRHIVPNLLGVVIVTATLTVPQVILVESFLSFLGLGVQEPATSWGVLVNDGAADMEVAPWALLFPASFLVLTLLCLNFLGDALRDVLDPRERR